MRRLKRLFMWLGCMAFGHAGAFRISTSEGDFDECVMCGRRRKLAECQHEFVQNDLYWYRQCRKCGKRQASTT